MIDYRVDSETGALIFTPNTYDKIKDLERKIKEKDKAYLDLLKRVEKLEKDREGNNG